MAAVVDKENDDYRLHIADTLIAGGYKNDLRSLEILVNEGPEDVLRLIKEMGVDFDRDSQHHIAMTLEGGHSRRRILHHKDSTGREITEKLLAMAQSKPNISFLEYAQLATLTPADGGFWAGLLVGDEYRSLTCSYCVLCTGRHRPGVPLHHQFRPSPPATASPWPMSWARGSKICGTSSSIPPPSRQPRGGSGS